MFQRQAAVSFPLEEKKSVLAISIFAPRDEDIERAIDKLDASIKTMIFKLEVTKPADLTQSLLKKWMYMDNTPNDPYHLKHLKETINLEFKNQQCKNGKSLALFFGALGFFAYFALYLNHYLNNQYAQTAQERYSLIRTRRPSYLNIDDLDSPGRWKERKDLWTYTALLLLVLIFAKGIKPLREASARIEALKKANDLLSEVEHNMQQLTNLSKSKGQYVDNLLSFDEIKNELDKTVSMMSNKFKPS